jgi:hypothetical protein
VEKYIELYLLKSFKSDVSFVRKFISGDNYHLTSQFSMVKLSSTPNFQDGIRNICVRGHRSYENQRDTDPLQ